MRLELFSKYYSEFLTDIIRLQFLEIIESVYRTKYYKKYQKALQIER